MKNFKNILCVVEPDNPSKVAILKAIALAKNQQASITVVSILRGRGVIPAVGKNKDKLASALKEMIESKNQQLELFVKQYNATVKVNTKILVGITFIEVIREVLRQKHDLVIKCSSNPDWMERVFGSNDMHILRKCPCPVLMLQSTQIEPYRNILATVDLMEDDLIEDDGSRVQLQLNAKVMEYALSLSLADSSTLHIGSIWEAYGENFLRYGTFSRIPEDKVELYVEQCRTEHTDKLKYLTQDIITTTGKEALEYINPKTHLVKGKAAIEIPLMVQEYAIDLIVMGTVARTGIPGLIIGNTAEAILEQVRCSVLAIKPEGFQSPVTLIG